MNFTPLHVYSGYSYLKSSIKFEDYLKKAKILGYASLGLTDFATFTGTPRFVQECEKNKIKPIIGLDLEIEGFLFTFIVKSEEGYKNLLHLSFLAKQDKCTLANIREANTGLVVILSSNNQKIKDSFESDGFARAMAKLAKGIETFYLGLEQAEKSYMDAFREFAYNHGYSLLAFPFVKYINQDDALTLKMLESVANKEVLEIKKLSGSEYLLDEKALKDIFKDEEIEETNAVANTCDFKFVISRGKMLHFENDEKLTSDEYLKKIAFARLKELNLAKQIYIDRLNNELDVITSMGYSDYFLIVKDFIAYARANNILVGPGRGSAVGSLVAYLLSITQYDPLKSDLIFERFLNKERQTLPDIDTDFEDISRDKIVVYLKNRYGNNKVAKVMAVQKFGAKQALGDVGRIFNYDKHDIELFTKLIKKDDEKLSLRELYKRNADFRNLVNEDKYYLEIVTFASKLDGLPRQAGLHAAGIVINNDPLEDIIPIDIDSDGGYIEEFEKDYLEEQSLLKMDLLSIRNLTIVKDCLARIKMSEDIELNADSLPYDDPRIFELIRSGKTMGLFQIESLGMRKAIKTLKPTEFNDVIALLALYRPGPMQFIEEYAKRKQGRAKISYISPALKEILSSTYGIIVYQEQIMQIANKMAGFSFGEADLLRRAISKKDSKKLISYEKKFIDGSLKNGYSNKEASDVYKMIYKFGDYGFNKSHALGYAILTCRMAYLKAYYPKEFYASILSNSNSENFSTTISEIKASKIKVLNPDINYSRDNYLIRDDKIIFPLTAIKGISGIVANQIMDEREDKPFTDFFDFVVRVSKYKINSKQIMSLIDGGAFDNLEASRASLRMAIPAALNYASMLSGDDGEIIFDASMFPKPALIKAEDDKLFDLNKEFDALGLMISGSPLSLVKEKAKNLKLTNIAELASTNDNVKLAAMFRTIKSVKTKKGKPMAFATIYDDSGEMEITIFTDAYESSYNALKKNCVVIIEGYYNTQKEEFNVKNISKLEDVING